MQDLNFSDLEQTAAKLLYALAAYNTPLCQGLIVDLCDRLPLETVAGVLLISLERLRWLDANAFIWAVEQQIPTEVAQEIRRLISLTRSQQLIAKGLRLGEDFSMDSLGCLLLNDQAQAIA